MTGFGELGYRCEACGEDHAIDKRTWRCTRCGGLLDLAGFEPDLSGLRDTAGEHPGLWRYRDALPLPEGEEISLGEGRTPLVAVPDRPGVGFKLDYVMPTGSFKDRGAVMVVALGRRLKAERLMSDSSGNAGAALAAYAARAGIPCDIYVPRSTSPGKVGQLEAYGARVHLVPGSRVDTAEAAAGVAEEPGVLYASHVYNPFYFHGTKTYVFELFEALGGRLPSTLLLPVGNGTLVLGVSLALRELGAHGLLDSLPRIVAVQAAACAPLAAAGGWSTDAPVGATVAEGIAVARPPRGVQVVAAVRQTGGEIVTVTEDQIIQAHSALARSGMYVEPTAAACFAAYEAGFSGLGDGLPAGRFHTVIPLTGSGLKSKSPAELRT